MSMAATRKPRPVSERGATLNQLATAAQAVAPWPGPLPWPHRDAWDAAFRRVLDASQGLCRLAVKRYGRNRRMDPAKLDHFNAECHLAVLSAVKVWEPARGAFTTCLRFMLWQHLVRASFHAQIVRVPILQFERGVRLPLTSLDAPDADGVPLVSRITLAAPEVQPAEAPDWPPPRLTRAIQTLPPTQQRALALVYGEGLSHVAAAERLGIARQTARDAASLGVRTLRVILRPVRESFL
jgi:hypothetical protein